MTKKRKFTIRTLFNDIHLWLGFISGIVIFLVCLSGTILTYEHEIKELFSEEMVVTPSGERKSLESLKNSLSNNVKGDITGVTIPSEANKPYEFKVKTSPKDRRGTTFFVNPYTEEFSKTEKSSVDGFLFAMFKLHRWLLLDTSIGRPIVGIATIIFLILAITGLILWFPRNLKWKYIKAGFKIKTAAKWKRINFDLHNTLGFYACIFIVIMGVTGLCWSFEGYRDGLSKLMGTKVFGNRGQAAPSAKNKNTANQNTINFDEALQIANNTLKYSGKTNISFPNKKNPAFSFRKYDDSSWSTVAVDMLTIDKHGNILNKKLYKDIPTNEKIASAIRPIHTGEIFGGFSKLLYFIACLIATSLPITGTLIWYNKLKKNKKWYLS